MKKLWLLLIPVIVLVAFAALRRSAPPEIPFTRATRETIVSTLTTNGKVEPIEFSAIRAEVAGAVEHIYVDKGQTVAQGQLLLRQNPGQATGPARRRAGVRVSVLAGAAAVPVRPPLAHWRALRPPIPHPQ